MKVLKCDIKDVQAVKRFLMDSDFLDFNYLPNKEKNDFFFVLNINGISEFEKNTHSFKVKLVNKSQKDFTKKKIKLSFKDELKKYFSLDEIKRLKTAYDVVGSIAILEIDDEFKDRQEKIANIILNQNKNIKTVLKKSDIHKGVFRTQAMTYLAGINTKVTTYLENGVKIKLNVEDVYFSPRLATERKRIANLVKPNEEIIELFSGCAPYSLVIAKKTFAKNIYGIELNPKGHIYGCESIAINKVQNVKLFCGDVRKLLPKFNTLGIGKKGHYSNFDKIYFKDMQIFELQLVREDLEDKNKFVKVKKFVKNLADKGIMVMLHHVPFFMNKEVGILDNNIDILEKKLNKFFELSEYGNILGYSLHMSDNGIKNYEKKNVDLQKVDKNLLDLGIKNLNYLFKKYKKFNLQEKLYLENGIYMFNSFDDFIKLKKHTGLKNVVLDIVHLFLSNIYSKYLLKNKKTDIDYVKFRNLILDFKNNFNTYFHIGDTTGTFPEQKDACKIGEGIIDFTKFADVVDFGVIEVWNYFSKEYVENNFSYDFFVKLRNEMTSSKKFDRILMPLPKTAEEFLDSALLISKKGTIIHFYDFLNEKNGEIPDLGISKIDKACKRNKINYEILNYVKCGDHAPHTFRVCIDFKIL